MAAARRSGAFDGDLVVDDFTRITARRLTLTATPAKPPMAAADALGLEPPIAFDDPTAANHAAWRRRKQASERGQTQKQFRPLVHALAPPMTRCNSPLENSSVRDNRKIEYDR
jgi:hypothetical protein